MGQAQIHILCTVVSGGRSAPSATATSQNGAATTQAPDPRSTGGPQWAWTLQREPRALGCLSALLPLGESDTLALSQWLVWPLLFGFHNHSIPLGPDRQGVTLMAITTASPHTSRCEGSVTSPGLAQGCLVGITTQTDLLSAGESQARRHHLALVFHSNVIPDSRIGQAYCSATAPLTTVPMTASGAFNPLHGVLCILRLLYLCAIGPRSVCFLVMDTHHTSNCSPKPLYSRMPDWQDSG